MDIDYSGGSERSRREELAELVRELEIGICIRTGGNLRKGDVERLHFRYNSAMTACSEGEVERIGGGVLILAYHVRNTDEFEGAEIANKATATCAAEVPHCGSPPFTHINE